MIPSKKKFQNFFLKKGKSLEEMAKNDTDCIKAVYKFTDL